MVELESAVATGLWSPQELHAILACPNCRASLAFRNPIQADCDACGRSYPRLPHSWDLTPPRERLTAEAWDTWKTLQRNGVASYEADPEHNLAVGDRPDCLAFGRFCELSGDVLDVGCGPQPWPTHFDTAAPGTRFVGVDPLVGERRAGYPQMRGLAEHLPFLESTFDHVVFATTLDHFVDPGAALREAARVLRPDATIDVFIGHKREGGPAPATSPDWYLKLEPPEGHDDLFHLERLDPEATEAMFVSNGLTVRNRETRVIDPYRSHHFFRLVPEPSV